MSCEPTWIGETSVTFEVSYDIRVEDEKTSLDLQHRINLGILRACEGLALSGG